MDITRTVPKHEESWWVEQLFDGSADMYYPLPIIPRKANVGDWLYTIYKGKIVGRNKITSIKTVDQPVGVGTEHFSINARCIIYLECPGEKAPSNIFRKGHQSIRYDHVPEWPSK